jgi:hypothetical protein
VKWSEQGGNKIEKKKLRREDIKIFINIVKELSYIKM